MYILSAVRTPIGKFGGTMASLTAADMGVVAAKAAIERAGVRPEQVEEVIAVGVPNAAMPGWKGTFGSEGVRAVTAYVYHLAGREVPASLRTP